MDKRPETIDRPGPVGTMPAVRLLAGTRRFDAQQSKDGRIGLLVLLQSIGISITRLLTALGVGGLAVALQNTLARGRGRGHPPDRDVRPTDASFLCTDR
jgi:hypothetical protein